jgi:glc operon protein GlcG
MRLLRSTAFLMFALSAIPVSYAQQPAPYGAPLSLAQSQKIIDAAQAKAAAQGYLGAIAVVGPSGELINYRKLDGSGYAQAAREKAVAAAVYRRPTKAFADAVQSGSAGVMSLPGVIASEGGIPIIVEGHIVGAVGASGGTPQQDGMIAAAGAAALP